jgi:hypothetical protein
MAFAFYEGLVLKGLIQSVAADVRWVSMLPFRFTIQQRDLLYIHGIAFTLILFHSISQGHPTGTTFLIELVESAFDLGGSCCLHHTPLSSAISDCFSYKRTVENGRAKMITETMRMSENWICELSPSIQFSVIPTVSVIIFGGKGESEREPAFVPRGVFLTGS